MAARPIGQILQLAADRVVFVGGRAAHHVALDVAAGGQRGELDLVDAADRLLQVVFQNAVQLQPLTAGDAQRGVADFVAQIQFGQKLIARQFAAGNPGADHERIGFGRLSFVPLDPSGGARVAVVLLVGAVVFQELDAGFAERIGVAGKLFGNGSAQIVTFELESLNRTWLGFVGHRLMSVPASEEGKGRMGRDTRSTAKSEKNMQPADSLQ